MFVMMNVVHDSNDEPSDSLQVMPLPSTGDGSEVSSFARTFCHRARIAFHNLASHPIFLVSIILMLASSVTLLAFACVRLSARRARWATFQRQYRVSFYYSLVALLIHIYTSWYFIPFLHL